MLECFFPAKFSARKLLGFFYNKNCNLMGTANFSNMSLIMHGTWFNTLICKKLLIKKQNPLLILIRVIRPDAGVHPSNHSGQVASPSHSTHFGVSSQPAVHVLDIGRKLEYLDRTSHILRIFSLWCDAIHCTTVLLLTFMYWFMTNTLLLKYLNVASSHGCGKVKSCIALRKSLLLTESIETVWL